jgi:hypothetical protein
MRAGVRVGRPLDGIKYAREVGEAGGIPDGLVFNNNARS